MINVRGEIIGSKGICTLLLAWLLQQMPMCCMAAATTAYKYIMDVCYIRKVCFSFLWKLNKFPIPLEWKGILQVSLMQLTRMQRIFDNCYHYCLFVVDNYMYNRLERERERERVVAKIFFSKPLLDLNDGKTLSWLNDRAHCRLDGQNLFLCMKTLSPIYTPKIITFSFVLLSFSFANLL